MIVQVYNDEDLCKSTEDIWLYITDVLYNDIKHKIKICPLVIKQFY